MPQLRTLHVINGLGTGGAERSLAEMLPYFLREGIEPVIVCSHHRTEGVHEQVAALGLQIEMLKGSSLPARTLSLRRILSRTRPSLVHTSIFESDLMGRLAAMGTSVPVLTSIVNTSYDDIRVAVDPNVSRRKLRMIQSVDAYTARGLTTWFHAITRAVRDSAVNALEIDPERITVIERGRDPERLGERTPARRARVRQSLELAPDAEVLLTVGRQEFQKGQRYLLEAVVPILERNPRAVLLIAGRPGNASGELQALHSAMPHSDRVRFLGHRDDIPDLLCAADLFVFPSLFEGLGGALLEAMALELPIITSRIPALEEVVSDGRNALLLEPARADLLTGAIESLLLAPDKRREFAAHGREIFLQRFTLEAIALRMSDLLRFVAAQGRGSRTCPHRPMART